MNKATPPEAKGVGTNSKLYPEIKGVEINIYIRIGNFGFRNSKYVKMKFKFF